MLVVVCSLALGAVVLGGPSLVAAWMPHASASLASQDPRSVGLDQADLPAGLSICPTSAAIGTYLQRLQASGSPSYEVTARQWATFQGRGAAAGWVQSYTQLPEDCAARLGERSGPSAISFAIRFRSEAQAVGAFRSGFLGLRPQPGMVIPGLRQGSATELSPQAWVYDQTTDSPGIFAAFWSKREFNLFLFTERLPADASRQAALSMNKRVH